MQHAAYQTLAEWFEYLNDDCDYQKWSQYFIRGLNEYHSGKKGLEIGCGSGYFCRALAKEGYLMTGLDLSQAMIAKAQVLSREEGLNIPFVLMDALKLKTPDKYDFAIAPNDCYNYIPHAKLSSAFKKVAACLKLGGLFWLDISSEYKLTKKIANNIFADDREEVTYLSFNSLYEDRVEMDVTLFARQEDGRFVRFDEKHVQYVHTEEAVKEALTGAGFTVLAVEGHFGEEKQGSDRLNFICRKQ